MGLTAPAGARIEGDTLAVFASSSFAERGFCSVCGSAVFYRMRDGPEMELSAGLFDASHMRLSREIFHDTKPAFYAFGGEADKRTRAQVMRAWLPRLIGRRIARLLGRPARHS